MAKQSSDTLEKIASSGKERPPCNDSNRSVAEILYKIFPIFVLAGFLSAEPPVRTSEKPET